MSALSIFIAPTRIHTGYTCRPTVFLIFVTPSVPLLGRPIHSLCYIAKRWCTDTMVLPTTPAIFTVQVYSDTNVWSHISCTMHCRSASNSTKTDSHKSCTPSNAVAWCPGCMQSCRWHGVQYRGAPICVISCEPTMMWCSPNFVTVICSFGSTLNFRLQLFISVCVCVCVSTCRENSALKRCGNGCRNRATELGCNSGGWNYDRHRAL